MTAIVVTGVGAVTGWGVGVEPLWQGMLAAGRAFRPIVRFQPERHRTTAAAEVPNLSDLPHPQRRLTLADRFALSAAGEALN